jgi:hydroxyethylthiazole kinase
VITGKTDFVAGGGKLFAVDNGAEIMGRVVGTGCMAASMIGCFAAVIPGDQAWASAAGLSVWGIAGEMAAEKSSGAGGFLLHIYDALSAISPDEIIRRQRISVL